MGRLPEAEEGMLLERPTEVDAEDGKTLVLGLDEPCVFGANIDEIGDGTLEASTGDGEMAEEVERPLSIVICDDIEDAAMLEKDCTFEVGSCRLVEGIRDWTAETIELVGGVGTGTPFELDTSVANDEGINVGEGMPLTDDEGAGMREDPLSSAIEVGTGKFDITACDEDVPELDTSGEVDGRGVTAMVDAATLETPSLAAFEVGAALTEEGGLPLLLDRLAVPMPAVCNGVVMPGIVSARLLDAVPGEFIRATLKATSPPTRGNVRVIEAYSTQASPKTAAARHATVLLQLSMQLSRVSSTTI